MKKFYWSAISDEERIKAISEITEIINRHANISDFKKFSDISLNLIIEAEERKLNGLLNSLKNILSVKIDHADFTDSTTECIVLLNITFTKGTGDLEIEVPNIPE
jgi:hypothetical protein